MFHLLAQPLVHQTHGVIWSVPRAIVAAVDGHKRGVDLLAIARDALIVGELKARSTAFRRAYIRDLARLARDVNADIVLLGGLDDWTDELPEKAATWVGP